MTEWEFTVGITLLEVQFPGLTASSKYLSIFKWNVNYNYPLILFSKLSLTDYPTSHNRIEVHQQCRPEKNQIYYSIFRKHQKTFKHFTLLGMVNHAYMESNNRIGSITWPRTAWELFLKLFPNVITRRNSEFQLHIG